MTFINYCMYKKCSKKNFESKLKCDEMDHLQFLLVAKQFEDKDINYLSSHNGAKQIPNEIFTTYLKFGLSEKHTKFEKNLPHGCTFT